MADVPGTDYQGIALVISSTTALVALGVPVLQRFLDNRDRRRRAKKEQIEDHLFFILDNYRDQLWGVDKFLQNIISRERPELTAPDDFMRFSMHEFSTRFVKLRALAAVNCIDDGGFCAAVKAYSRHAVPPLTDATR